MFHIRPCCNPFANPPMPVASPCKSAGCPAALIPRVTNLAQAARCCCWHLDLAGDLPGTTLASCSGSILPK